MKGEVLMYCVLMGGSWEHLHRNRTVYSYVAEGRRW